MKHLDFESRFESFLLLHAALLSTSSGPEYRDVAREYYRSYMPNDLIEETFLASMVFSRFMIRRMVNLETLFEQSGHPRSLRDLRVRHHRRYTKVRKMLEKLQAERQRHAAAGC